MAAPVWESADTKTATGNSASLTVDKPSNLADNDVVVLGVEQRDRGSDPALAPPSGFTEEYEIRYANNVDVAMAYKVITDAASEPASYTYTSGEEENWTAAAGRVSGADTTDPTDVSGTDTGDSSDPVAPSITTTIADTLLLAQAGTDSQSAAPWSPPSGYTEEWDLSQGTTFSTAGSGATKTQASAGASGTATFTTSSDRDWATGHVAFAPGVSAVTITLVAATMTFSAQALTVTIGRLITLVAATVVSAAQTLTVNITSLANRIPLMPHKPDVLRKHPKRIPR